VSVGHYENFPVASRAAPSSIRLGKLSVYQAHLVTIAAGETPGDPLFREVASIVRKHALLLHLFKRTTESGLQASVFFAFAR